jgi:hypothetical protein
MKYTHIFLFALITWSCSQSSIPTKTEDGYASTLAKHQKYEGFYDFYWDEDKGKILLEIETFDEEFLYINYLSAGIGSNDIGLDRGQIGDNRIVKFQRSGAKVLLIQPNYGYRAISDNKEEVRSVEEAFAKSVLWGFKVEKEENGKVLIDLTDFLLSDVHGVSEALKNSKQGTYALDASRSIISLDRTKNFPENSEFEALLTFKGTPAGAYIKSVAPTAEAVSVQMHHSFVKLPDSGYKKRSFDPRSGFYTVSYQDYATPIEEPLVKQFIYRHRLEKKDPTAEKSEAVKPIIYYVDKGAPEPVKSALIEGASWWNQAFEAAGYLDAFQVKVLPDSIDPLDIRYNVIQWVHRATRGWSYGSWIADPRTGEIIKGHVSLGSLRIRQDFLIATGLLQPYEDGKEPSAEMLEMALARLRQLSAHEVGHTLGLYHNFAASANDRSSVMDYPHPYIELDENGNIDLSNAYATGIGSWDKFAIRYGYTDFGDNDQKSELEVIKDWIAEDQQFITDSDARPLGSAHPQAHLWDNGNSAAEELNRLIEIRAKVLSEFSEKAIQTGAPISSLEEVLVPMYFLHRYQIEGASKVIGGLSYAYKVKGDDLPYPSIPDAKSQKEALSALSNTLSTSFLSIPENLLNILSPKVPGYPRTRESFKSNTGLTFDPIAASETSAEMTLELIFNPQRIERVIQQNLRNSELPSWKNVVGSVYKNTWGSPYGNGLDKEIKMVVEKRVIYHLMNLTVQSSSTEMTKAIANAELSNLMKTISAKKSSDSLIAAHYVHCLSIYNQFIDEPSDFKLPDTLSPPDGSPIGMDCMLSE